MATRPFHYLRDIARLVTGDLTRNELERLVTDETRGMYEFYLRNVPPPDMSQRRVTRAMRFMGALFRAFLQRLSPSRRFVYAVSVVVFVIGYMEDFGLYVWLAFGAVNFLLALEVADKLLTRDDLALAREIQEGLHPSDGCTLEHYGMAALGEVAREVGGDFYDVKPLPDGSVLAMIGDVSGKGIAAALYAVKAQTALDLFIADVQEPDVLLSKLNRHLYRNMKRGYFLTVALARLCPDGRVQFCRAGHPPAMIFRTGTGEMEQLQPRGVAIGMAPAASVGPAGSGGGSHGVDKTFEELAELGEVRLAPGDLFILYSDGLIESADRSGREFGVDRLAAIFRAFPDEPLPALRDRLVHTVRSFRDGTDLRDDTTAVIFRYTAS
jgi:phosphoserine phosphatase RsbU/P